MDDAQMRAELEQLHAASYGWALSCCDRDAALAEDVLQTAYLKVLQGRARYGGQSAFKTWLFAVIRHTAADERRRHWLRRLKLVAYGREHAEAVNPAVAAGRLEQSERRQMFRQALAALPHRQQQVLHLVFYQDLTVQQAAEVMGVSIGSARTHYERGKQKLRQWWKNAEVQNEHGFTRQQSPATLS